MHHFVLALWFIAKWHTNAQEINCTNKGIPCSGSYRWEYDHRSIANIVRKKSSDIRFRLSDNQQSIDLQISPMEDDKYALLGNALTTIIAQNLEHCDLGIAFDSVFENTAALRDLIQLQQLRQIVRIKKAGDFLSLLWKSNQCSGYIFLLHNPEPFLAFCNDKEEPWDYQAKYVVAGLSKTYLDAFASSKKGNKTEHIVGLVQEFANEWKVYRNQLYWGTGVVVVNRWRQQGFTSDGIIFPHDKTTDLRGANITLITFAYEPHVIITDAESRPYGRDIQIADTIAETLNFSLVIIKSPQDEFWGIPDSDGNWSGMNGAVQRNEGHFGMAYSFLSNNDARTDAIDFSHFYEIDPSCFMIRVEPPLPRWQSLAIPFEKETWLAVFVCLLLFCPILYLLTKASADSDNAKGSMQLSYSYLYTIGAHGLEPLPQLPKKSSVQIWVVCLWIYCFILTTIYSCNLTAFLTVERAMAGIDTIQELHSSTMKVVAYGCFFKVSLEASENIYLKDLATQKYVKYQDLSGQEEMKKMLVNGDAVFLETRTHQDYLIVNSYTQRGVPYIRIMKECYVSNNIGITLQNHLPLTKSINRIIGRLIDHGILRKWYKDLLQSLKKTSNNSSELGELAEEPKNEGVIPLNIDHMQGIFYVYLIGQGLASLVSFVEVSCCRRKRLILNKMENTGL